MHILEFQFTNIFLVFPSWSVAPISSPMEFWYAYANMSAALPDP